MYKFDKATLFIFFAIFFSSGMLFCMVTIAIYKYMRTEMFLCVDGVLFERKANDIFENTGKRCLRMNDERIY